MHTYTIHVEDKNQAFDSFITIMDYLETKELTITDKKECYQLTFTVTEKFYEVEKILKEYLSWDFDGSVLMTLCVVPKSETLSKQDQEKFQESLRKGIDMFFVEPKEESLEELEAQKEEINQQLIYLQKNKSISHQESSSLEKDYQDKLQEINTKKQNLINKIKVVNAKMLHPNGYERTV